MATFGHMEFNRLAKNKYNEKNRPSSRHHRNTSGFALETREPGIEVRTGQNFPSSDRLIYKGKKRANSISTLINKNL